MLYQVHTNNDAHQLIMIAPLSTIAKVFSLAKEAQQRVVEEQLGPSILYFRQPILGHASVLVEKAGK